MDKQELKQMMRILYAEMAHHANFALNSGENEGHIGAFMVLLDLFEEACKADSK